MQFRRITVRNYRKLLAPVTIDGIGNGATIIAGDNEEGKSTLLDAIRSGLFERHNVTGKAIARMQPFGSSVRPEVELELEIDGAHYTINKGFAQKPAARLTTPGGTFEGSAAEQELAQLLEFRPPKRGGATVDDQGVLGLFYLQQGRVVGGLGVGEHGQATLRSALEAEVGDVLGGPEGQKVLQQARAKREAHLTRTGKPTGDLKDALENAEAAADELAKLERERQEYDQHIEELGRIKQSLEQIERDHEIAKAEERLHEAKQRVKAIDALRDADERAESQLKQAKAEFENADKSWKARQRLIEVLVMHEKRVEALKADLPELEAHMAAIDKRLQAARGDLKAAAERRAQAEVRAELARQQARIIELSKQSEELEGRLSEIAKLDKQRKEANELLAEVKVDDRRFQQLQSLTATIAEHRATLRGIATRVKFSPTGGQAVSHDGTAVQAGDNVEVTEPASFTLEGFGSVEVAPGARGIDAVREALGDAEGRLERALAAGGAENVEGARKQLDARKKAEQTLKEVDRLIAAHAPEGVGSLRTEHGTQAEELERLKQSFDAAAAADLGDPDVELRAYKDARKAEEQARTAVDTVQEERQRHETDLAVARSELRSASTTLQDARRELEEGRADLSDSDLAAKLEEARAKLKATGDDKRQTAEQLAAANPDEAALKRKQAEDALDAIEKEYDRLRTDAIALKRTLAALGKDGLEERLEEARARATQAEGRLDRLQADADAWDLLVKTLTEAEQDAKQAFLEPVLARVDPFLKLVLPGARVSLEAENLEIAGIERDGQQEPFEDLSIGTREQLSILVRLAFAVYLKEKGYPAAVILDDALVYADDGRFERMQLALRKAAQKVQVLILTCRVRDWRHFGAPIRRLADGRAKDNASRRAVSSAV